MKRPEDLKIKLYRDKPHYDPDSGVGYIMTTVGYSLYLLSEMWDMSQEEVVDKIANAAAAEEERFVVDGEYVKPHRRMVPCYAEA